MPRWVLSLWRVCISVILANIALLFLALDGWIIRQTIERAAVTLIFGV